MRTLLWVAILGNFVAFTSTLNKPGPIHAHGYHLKANRKRFLFNPGNNANTLFCYGFCNLSCPSGYQKAPMGCYLCACVDVSSAQSYKLPQPSSNQFQPANFSINAGTHGKLFTNPCNPSIRHCPLRCTLGFETGANGCEMCACVTSTSNVTVSPLSQATKSPIRSTSLRSKSTLPSSTTFASTSSYLPSTRAATSQASPVTVRQHAGYADPCIPTQTSCSTDCHGDYVIGPEGCQYCLCADKIPSSLRITTTPAQVVTSGLDRSNTSFVPTDTTSPSPDLSSEVCIMAKVICNEKCPAGFVSKPDDCLFCSCTASMSVPSDEIKRVDLHKPCLYKSHRCLMKCTKGYIRGPRDCQFCSCRK